ncbi:AAA family ATPase [Pseudomonas carnis]|uniref:AAA family ATPase n=1 Tax=Pseudomonas carnis TaxID=2487355 RepID=UPI0018E61340|nr:AAA family ATPase [Pseudomonas carnis]MBI6656626.1 AAA family ATPase [Pseudomonas carnis]MBI6664647.1 AAA family ATPase [Pseudomonas carnis]MBI6687324.1 AAA family ATPase [Pseudomonas carnis]
MRIQHVEISNFRKLLSVRIDFANETTLLVGANNSGKSSAMLALRRFLVSKASAFRLQDLTLCHLAKLEEIGKEWENPPPDYKTPTAKDWADWLPSLDIWVSADQGEFHFIRDLIPSFEWRGGLVGMRFLLEPDDMNTLYTDYRKERSRVAELEDALGKEDPPGSPLTLWPQSLHDYLNRRLRDKFKIRWYRLDPKQLEKPEKSTRMAQRQQLSPTALPLESNPLSGLIRVHEINAQRGFGDHSDDNQGDSTRSSSARKLSEQLRSYYSRHLDPGDSPDISDLEALRAIEAAQSAFDTKLGSSFEPAIREVEGLGYPGRNDPRIKVASRLATTDGMNHEAAVMFELDSIQGAPGAPPLHLPETANGLGYQNLISMIFRLMGFRDEWLRKTRAASKEVIDRVEPIHLVLIEEPEAHLHVQVQQVFVRHAYQVLCRDALLERYPNLKTQLLVSTHSSHVTHEMEYQNLRYFRRLPAGMYDIGVPVSTVSNLSNVFGEGTKTKEFVTRYLRAQHADIFFADAVILVEGSAERMMLPHFLRNEFPFLDRCYITTLDIGGSHAHRLRPLIDALGILTLVITDLDAGLNKAAKPVQRNADQITNNPTLRSWMKLMHLGSTVDELLELPANQKEHQIDDLYSVRIAYQTPISTHLPATGEAIQALPNTFEDSFVLSNAGHFAEKTNGTGLMKAFVKVLNEAQTSEAVGEGFFNALREGKKAEFVLLVLGDKNFPRLEIPEYICEGLNWLESKLRSKQKELLVIPPEGAEVTP